MTPSAPKPKASLKNQRGIAAINIAITGTVLVAMAAFAIDIGHALVTQNELQNAADSAALAAGRELGVTYIELPVSEQKDMSRDLTGTEQTDVIGQATTAAYANGASDLDNITIAQGEVELGRWDFAASTFTPGITRPNAIRVTARRDGVQNGPISTFFAGIMGVTDMDVSATSVAALGTAGGPAAPGAVNAPFGISEDWFTGTATCGDTITFSPTGTQGGCAGWHQFDEEVSGGNKPKNCSTTTTTGGGGGSGGQSGANAHMMDQVIECLDAGNYTSPPIYPGVTQFEFTGGEVSSAFPELQDMYNNHKNSAGEWHISVPVYEANNCANPTGPVTIVGYAKVAVTQVTPPQGQGQGYIEANVQCDAFFDGAPTPNPIGGGGAPTPLSPYPRLVS